MKKIKKGIQIILTLILFITCPLNPGAASNQKIGTAAVYENTGSAYYVSPDGSDKKGKGSKASPWKTLQHAANNVVAGDTVIVEPGKYNGFVLGWDAPQNGTKDRPIVFKAQHGAVIDQRNSKTPDGINLEGASYIVIDGFEITGMPRAGIRSVSNHHVTLKNNRTDSNEAWGIFTGFSDDLVIENNEACRSKTQHGIYVSNSCKGAVIRRNNIWGNFACGIHLNGDLSAGAPGIITGAVIEGNTIYDNGEGGGSGINCDGMQNSIIRNNLLFNNHASGISLYAMDAAEGSKNNQVTNNTLLAPDDARWVLNIRDRSTGNRVCNNILYHAGEKRGSITITRDSLQNFTCDYNVLVSRLSSNDGDTVLDLPQWQKSAGYDKHSLLASPEKLFVNVLTNNYHLSKSSPAINAGTALKAPITDMDGKKRPRGGKFDIGAYEY